jgi:hypothetical protein
VKIEHLLSVNAIIFIGLGIAFALYGPLMIDFFGIMAYEGNAVLYWYAASFSRLLGASLFGFGFLMWAIRGILADEATPLETRRGIILALLLGSIFGLIVAITQQVSVWGALIGWGIVMLFAVLVLGYTFFLVSGRNKFR